MQLMITRSDEWTHAQRLARGENVHTSIEVEVSPAELSEPARDLLLRGGGGHYPDLLTEMPFTSDYTIASHGGYGTAKFCIDTDSPTVAEIDAAIVAAGKEVEDKKQEHDARIAAKEAANQKEKEEREQAAAKRLAAREVLGEEIEVLERNFSDSKRSVAILSEFIRAIPPDAKRGALRKLAADDQEENEKNLRGRVEGAASVWVLNDLEDDEDGEDAEEG